jgi:hypothetical protein
MPRRRWFGTGVQYASHGFQDDATGDILGLYLWETPRSRLPVWFALNGITTMEQALLHPPAFHQRV